MTKDEAKQVILEAFQIAWCGSMNFQDDATIKRATHALNWLLDWAGDTE